MANKTLFKSLVGKLMPATDALNDERAPAYALSPKHQLAQYAATGCLSTTFYATADDQLAKVLDPISEFARGELNAGHWVGEIEAVAL